MSSPSLPYVSVTVSFNDKPLKTQSFTATEIVIGRGTDCDVQLDNPGASRMHARILREGDVLFVEDLASGNGTFVNAQQIRRHPLQPGDQIAVSKYTITAQLSAMPIEDAEPAPSALPAQDEGHTVFLRPQERSKVSGAAAATSHAAHITRAVEVTTPAPRFPTTLVFVAGLLTGILLGWIRWHH